MEDPAFPTHPPRNSKRMFGGSSSSSSTFLDADVIEIPPPPSWKSNRAKHNSNVQQEVIVVDDEDLDDVVILDDNDVPKNKGKKPMLNYGAPNGNSSAHASIVCDNFDGIDLNKISYDDECVMLQAHFDNSEVPAGIEATVPWWPASSANQSSSSSFVPQPQSDVHAFKAKPFPSWGFEEMQFNNYYASDLPYFGSQLPLSVDPVNTSAILNSIPQWTTSQFPPSAYQVHPFKKGYIKKWGTPSHSTASPVVSHLPVPSPFFSGVAQGFQDHSLVLDDNISAQISPPSTSGQGGVSENLILKKLDDFKKFDTLEDFSDHLYTKSKVSAKQSKSWGKKISEEWRMLEKDLPDTIFARVYESRMDLLRAVIVGADGTPYHDGLFFFDVNFTDSYPHKPPHVKYHSHGLRINPNLYNCGKVCLSLLGTWSGCGAENWRPCESNMLQVLVSIQGLILNAEPYYNEPGYANSKGTTHGRNSSKSYSENTFLLSLKTMLYTLRKPPKYFEDLIFGHFYKRAHNILAASRAYLDGLEVGSFDQGKSLADQTQRRTCSPLLKSNLPAYIKNLVEAFIKIGVKDCEKYLAPVDNAPTNAPSRFLSNKRKR